MVSANDSVTLQRLLSSLVFVQKFKFILMKMHKNCCHQSYSFWLRYAPNRLSAGVSLQTPLGSLQHSPRPSSWFRGWGPGEKGRRDEGEKEGGEGKGRDLKCKWISVILVRCGLWCPAGHSARAITFPTLYQ